jgi:hypothetical protein
MRVQVSSVGERSPVFLRWMAVSLHVRKALTLSSIQHLMKDLLSDQTRDEENLEILAALSKCRNTRMLKIMLVRHWHFFSSHLCQSGIDFLASGSIWYCWAQISLALLSFDHIISMSLTYVSIFSVYCCTRSTTLRGGGGGGSGARTNLKLPK